MVGRIVAITALAALGVLNRETTGMLIGLSVFAVYPRHWRYWMPVLLVTTFLFLGLRVLIDAPACCSIAQVWSWNTEPWRLTGAQQFIGLLSPVLALCVYGWVKSEWAIRRSVIIVLLPYLVLVALFGVWQEVRLLMPIFILSIPLLRHVFEAQS